MIKQKRNSILLFSLYALLNSALASYSPYLNLRYRSQNIGVNLIGVLATIAPLVSIIVAPAWGKAIDKSGNRRKYIIMLVVGSMVTICIYPFANKFLHFAIINFILAIFQTSISATVESLTLGMVERNGHNYSKIRTGGTIGYAATLIILGTIFSKYFNAAIIFSVISYTAMIGCVLALPKKETILPPIEVEKDSSEKLLGNKKIYIVLLMLLFSFMAHGFSAAYISLFLEELDRVSILSVVLFVGTISEFPILLLVQRIMNKYSTMALLLVSGVIGVIRLLLISSGILPLMILGQLLQGPSYMLNFYCGTMLVYELVPKNMKSLGQSTISVVQGGIGSMLANMGGGKLIELLGFKISYWIVAGVLLFITAICFLAYKKGFNLDTKSPTIT